MGLHEAVGFEKVGVYRGVGYKLGGWRDVGWWERVIQPRPALPQAPADMTAARAMAGWAAAFEAGSSLLKV